MRKVFTVILIGVCIVSLVGAGIYAVRYFSEESEIQGVEDEMAYLRELAQLPAEEDDAEDNPCLADPTEIDDCAQKLEVPEIPEDPMDRVINFDNLLSVNPDASRWVSIPDSTLDYVVMQDPTTDGSYYLWRDIYGKSSNLGIPLTPKIPMDIDDPHLLIFGHTFTNNRSIMFSTVKLYKNKAYWETHPYVYLYMPDRTEKWEAVYLCNVMEDDIVYNLPYEIDTEDYANLLKHLDTAAIQRLDGATLSPSERILVLSCCDMQFNYNHGRAILVCRLVETKSDTDSAEVNLSKVL